MHYLNPPQFVLCLFNEQNPTSLERGKLYRVVAPEVNDSKAYVRIVDESAEDYLFPRDWFVPMPVPKEAIEILTSEQSAAT